MVDYTSILRAAFTLVDPKNEKIHWWLDCRFALLESVSIKAVCKMLVNRPLRVDPSFGKIEFGMNPTWGIWVGIHKTSYTNL